MLLNKHVQDSSFWAQTPVTEKVNKIQSSKMCSLPETGTCIIQALNKQKAKNKKKKHVSLLTL